MRILSNLNPLMRKQLIGFAGAFPAVLISVYCWQNPELISSYIKLPSDLEISRLVFAISWMLAPAFMLLIGIIGASRRGFYSDAIEGNRNPQNKSLEINLRYNQNTIEQTIVAIIVWAALSIELPIHRLTIIPMFALLFVIGRITFWVGYLLNPMARTFGMTLTVFPTIIGFCWLIINNLS